MTKLEIIVPTDVLEKAVKAAQEEKCTVADVCSEAVAFYLAVKEVMAGKNQTPRRSPKVLGLGEELHAGEFGQKTPKSPMTSPTPPIKAKADPAAGIRPSATNQPKRR